jgi:hypothetical protein
MSITANRQPMTTTTEASPPAGAATETASRALAVRRTFLVACPILAGVFAVIGAYADPGAGISGNEMFRLYAEHPGPLQFKSLSFHWSYAFWIAPALLSAAYVRGRGAWIANAAALLGFLGMTTLPGLLFSDWYDSAIGQLYGPDAPGAVFERMSGSMWGVPVFTSPGIAGFMLALPLATVALWRARIVGWWALPLVLAGYAAFMLSNVMWWGCAITAVCFTAFARELARGTRPSDS